MIHPILQLRWKVAAEMLAFYIVSSGWTGRKNQAPRLYRVDVAPNVQSARHWVDGDKDAHELCHSHGPAPQSFSKQFLPVPCLLLCGGTRSVPVGCRQSRHYNLLFPDLHSLNDSRVTKKDYFSYLQ